MRAKIGDTIRLYGVAGVFDVVQCHPFDAGFYDYGAARDDRYLFGILDSSIVEVNGEPVPLQSCPISAPAEDYPHPPQFDYGANDGPPGHGQWALAVWREAHAALADV